LLKIRVPTALSSVQLFLVATRPLYLWLLDITSIGPFIYLSVTYTTTSDEHIATALCFLASLQFRNVCIYCTAIFFLNFHSFSPLASREFRDDAGFRKFRRQLLHSSLAKILESLKPGMTTPEVVRFPDGHFRKVIYGLGPYIADYPEQALLACIVQGWCAR
jgi:Plavaka transposase